MGTRGLRGLSLFANTGVAESLLSNVQMLVANEIDQNRCKFYKHIYPDVEMICGDIRNTTICKSIIDQSKKNKVDFIMATPPCQGMSTIGKLHYMDIRNQLIYYAIKVIKKIKPKYILLENVPQQKRTTIIINKREILIPDYIRDSLRKDYFFEESIINVADYGVPQIRKRSVYLLTRKDLNKKFIFLNKSEHLKHINLSDSIGHLPSLDPNVQEFNMHEQLDYFPDYNSKMEEGLVISKWHRPPVHKIRHIEVMLRTAEGKSALLNNIYYPKNKDGSRIKGYKNTYKRQSWHRPAYTVATYNGAICSQDNVHPGRSFIKNNNKLFSDPRVLSIYELMIIMSIPTNWNIPEWANDSLIRHSIGEGLPPLVVKKLINKLLHS
jgi:DNA (cytosine-5)-methyltransferase 1